jgi:hypothetical protein
LKSITQSPKLKLQKQGSFRKKIELSSTINSNENLNMELNLIESSPNNNRLPMNKKGNNYKTMAYYIPEETKITERT